jgi:hypothetical protein
MLEQRRRFKQQATLQDRISEWAIGVRERAATLPPGPDRDELLKKLRHAETAMHLQDWANSPGLQSPK